MSKHILKQNSFPKMALAMKSHYLFHYGSFLSNFASGAVLLQNHCLNHGHLSFSAHIKYDIKHDKSTSKLNQINFYWDGITSLV